MLVISWNARGLNACLKRALVKDLLVKFNPDVILQESKLDEVDRRIVKSLWSSRHVGWVALNAIGSSSSILIIWKEENIIVVDTIKG